MLLQFELAFNRSIKIEPRGFLDEYVRFFQQVTSGSGNSSDILVDFSAIFHRHMRERIPVPAQGEPEKKPRADENTKEASLSSSSVKIYQATPGPLLITTDLNCTSGSGHSR